MNSTTQVSGLIASAFALFGATLVQPVSAEEEEKRTRDEMVIDDRDALAGNAHWIYNDLDKAFATAKRDGRPLMVVHRCIP